MAGDARKGSGSVGRPPASDALHPMRELPVPVRRAVLMVIHDPILRSQGGRPLRERLGWNDPKRLARDYIDEVRRCSWGYANYQIVERVVVDGFPLKRDGFRYTEHSYLEALRAGRFHDPDGVDYLELVNQFDIIHRVNSGAIDEVWLFGPPSSGYWESIMAGPGAFWCNAPPLDGTGHCRRRFVIMGFNYERGVGEMLEDLGHRAESILSEVFKGKHGDAHLFERFTRYDLTHPNGAEAGSVHFAPNSLRDYDWGNPRPVLSRCDNWYNFPDLNGEPRVVTCREWGNGDIREHHRWWFRHFPHFVGESDGISWNWWEYVIDPNRVQLAG